jgi:tetratricopeptide (TPR) repeat protein
MLRQTSGRCLIVLTIALVAILFATPSYAQTGMVKGKVLDGAGKPLDKAKVLIEFKDGVNRRYEVLTNKKGEFIQIGLPPGNYKVTSSFPDLGDQTFDVRVRLGDAAEVNFLLGGGTGGKGGMSKEDAAKAAALKQVFEEGVALSKASDYDGAIAKFTEASTLVPNCYDCMYNIGFAHMQKKDFDNAEIAFNKAIEFKANYVDAYNGLATVYNAQKKFDKAQEMGAKAAEFAAVIGGSSGGIDAEYNQGVIKWNAGKIAEAKAHFEKVVFMKPDHADAHYQLGMANLNLGALPEAATMFEKYLELAPDGQYAAVAKGILSQIKK